jgi:hypothetical protein
MGEMVDVSSDIGKDDQRSGDVERGSDHGETSRMRRWAFPIIRETGDVVKSAGTHLRAREVCLQARKDTRLLRRTPPPMADTRQHLTVRLSPEDRKRVRMLSLSIGVPVQAIIIDGFNRTLADYGLDPLETPTTMPPPKKRPKPRGGA